MSDFLKGSIRQEVHISRAAQNAAFALAATAFAATGYVTVNNPPCGCDVTPTPGGQKLIPTATPAERYIPPTAVPTATPRIIPTEVPRPIDPTPTPRPNDLPRPNPECQLPSNWPQTPEEASKRIGGQYASWQMVRHIDANGRWNGGWDAEGFNKMKAGITFDGQVHRKADRSITYNHDEIFDKSAGVQHKTVVLTDPNGWMFARRGGDVLPGQKANVSFNVGTPGIAIEGVEQAAYSPICEECIPGTNIPKSVAEAWHNAIREYTWNADAQRNNIDIMFYNPTTSEFQQLNGNMISALTQAGIRINTENIPVGAPLFPGEAVKMTGNTTKAEWWTPVITDGTWNGQLLLEAFPIRTDKVHYDLNNGVFRDNASNAVVTDLSLIYNFDRWAEAKSQWPSRFSFPAIPQMRGFVRTGGGSDAQPGSSWFTSGSATTIDIGKNGFEQASLIPVCTDDPKAASQQDAQSDVSRKDVNHVSWHNGQGWIQLK